MRNKQNKTENMMNSGIVLTYSEIMSDKFIESFKMLLERDIPIQDAISISRSIDVINKEMGNFEKIKNELIKRLGIETKDIDGNSTGFTMEGVSQDNLQEFNNKFVELMNTKFKIPMNSPLKLTKSFGNLKGSQAYLLRSIIEFQEESN